MKIRHWEENNDPVSLEHKQLGLPPVETEVLAPGNHPILIMFAWLAFFMLLFAIGYGITITINQNHSFLEIEQLLTHTINNPIFWSAIIIGFIAQTIDGALGMAYGISSTSFLMFVGHPPAVASASVHIAEIFTTGVSGLSHIKMLNVEKKLFLRLLIPGIIGSVTGAFIITNIDGNIIKPYISAYLIIMGFYVISKAFRKIAFGNQQLKHVGKLAFLGGFVDSTGGGGWGPVVTTTLLGKGYNPRTTIGTVNFAEFFLTFICAFTFILFIENVPWAVVVGLVIGGVFAAPFAATLTRKLPAKILLFLVGGLISVISFINLYQAFR